MQNFTKILYASDGVTDETAGLKQALSLARNNQASLRILVTRPEMPEKLSDIAETFDQSLREQLKALLEAARTSINLDKDAVPVTVDLVTDDKPSVRIVQEVLRNDHDLLVKDATTPTGGSGFKAIDMALLRKCPCPVWLCRPIERSRNEMKIAVAIDPESDQANQHAHSVRLLQLARALADTCSGALDIVSCWSFEYEEFLRHSPWAKLPEEDISRAVAEAQDDHKHNLDSLIADANLSGEQRVHHVRGRAEDMIPAFVDDQSIDVLLMGTVARTGLAGFAIGNTAESIVQSLSSSLIALKPEGFVSPVKA